MSSIASYEPEYNIQLPKTNIMKTPPKMIPIPRHFACEVTPSTGRFDPNTVGTPPNAFMELLQQRMDIYFSGSLQIADDCVVITARDRGESFDIVMRKTLSTQ
jgi:hypothetical protein